MPPSLLHDRSIGVRLSRLHPMIVAYATQRRSDVVIPLVVDYQPIHWTSNVIDWPFSVSIACVSFMLR